MLMCGLLYQLTEPREVIRKYCGLAREGVIVTSVSSAPEDGYTSFLEAESIAASEDPSRMSMMPYASDTLAEEFARHGFCPLYLLEHRAGKGLWGGAG